MTKPADELLSNVTDVSWNRLDTEAPKKLGVPAGEAGVVSTNWSPESGAASSSASEYDPNRPARPGIRYAVPASELYPGAPIRIPFGWPASIRPAKENA